MFDTVEKLKTEYTDKYVVVDASRPELSRFQGLTGQVKTVNMSGRALVQFDAWNNIGWYDIGLDFLKVVPKPEPKPEEEKHAAKKAAPAAKPEAAKPAAAAATGEKKPSVLDMLKAAKAGGAAPAAPAASPAVKPEPVAAAPAPATEVKEEPKPAAEAPAGEKKKLSTAEILAALKKKP